MNDGGKTMSDAYAKETIEKWFKYFEDIGYTREACISNLTNISKIDQILIETCWNFKSRLSEDLIKQMESSPQ